MLAAHFSDNPGVTPEFRSYTKFKLKAEIRKNFKDECPLTNEFIESDPNHHNALNGQIKSESKKTQGTNLAQQTMIIKS